MPDIAENPFLYQFAGGAVIALIVVVYLALARPARDSASLAAAVLGGFVGFTAVAIWAEGPLGFLNVHIAGLWGVQVWYDLVISLAVALLFVAPRARAVGVRVPLYALATGLLGSIGLLALVARTFWLETRARS
jgi:hypothetical protein